MIEARHIRFDYIRRDEKKEVIALETALKDVSFEVKAVNPLWQNISTPYWFPKREPSMSNIWTRLRKI